MVSALRPLIHSFNCCFAGPTSGRGCVVPGLTRDVMEYNPGAHVGGLVRVESFRLCCLMHPIRDNLDELLVSARALCCMKYTARRAESIG